MEEVQRAALEREAERVRLASLEAREAALAAERDDFERQRAKEAERAAKKKAETEARKVKLAETRKLQLAFLGITPDEVKDVRSQCDEYLDKLGLSESEGGPKGGPRDFIPDNPEDMAEAYRIAAETGERDADVFSTLLGSPPSDFGIAA